MHEPNTEPSAEQSATLTAHVAPAISDIGHDTWNACFDSDHHPENPFVTYDFLAALEDAECVGPVRTGWLPQHISLHNDRDEVVAVAPAYAKLHSRGEYVFDYAWADAAERAGISYYPKLQISVPFTPVPGPRLLARPGHDRKDLVGALASAIVSLTRRIEASSAHVTFVDHETWQHLGELGFLQRIDQQFHWHNQGYASFDDFLGTLSSRKRKMVRKERQRAKDSGLEFRVVQGDDIREQDWESLYKFYIDTGTRKWGTPYLNRTFFTELGKTLSDACVLMFAAEDGVDIAGALHLLGGDCLYGRYWGMRDYYPFLHFELCYYRAMDYAIANNIPRLEAGAQGEHKLLRGYMPTPTYSAHWIEDVRLRNAIRHHLNQEREDISYAINALSNYGPYRKQSDDDKTG